MKFVIYLVLSIVIFDSSNCFSLESLFEFASTSSMNASKSSVYASKSSVSASKSSVSASKSASESVSDSIKAGLKKKNWKN